MQNIAQPKPFSDKYTEKIFDVIFDNISKGDDTLWNISFRRFHETSTGR